MVKRIPESSPGACGGWAGSEPDDLARQRTPQKPLKNQWKINIFESDPPKILEKPMKNRRSVRTVRTDRPYANEKMRRPMKVRRPEVRNRNFYHLVDYRPLLMARLQMHQGQDPFVSFVYPERALRGPAPAIDWGWGLGRGILGRRILGKGCP